MKKTIFLLLLFTGLHAYTYNNELMKIYAKIAPRLVLMSESENKTPKGTIDICILYERGDDAAAKKLQEMMLALYPQGLGGRRLNIRTTRYVQHIACDEHSLLFLLDTDPLTMKPSLDYAKKNAIATISYSNRFLSTGVVFSVHVGKTVRPYLNIEAAKQNNITLESLLIQISKIYSAEDEQ